MRPDTIDAPELPSILFRIREECQRHDDRWDYASTELWPLFRLQISLLQLFVGLLAFIGLAAHVFMFPSEGARSGLVSWLVDWLPGWTVLGVVAVIAAPEWLAHLLDDRASTVLRAYGLTPIRDGETTGVFDRWPRFLLVSLWLGQRITRATNAGIHAGILLGLGMLLVNGINDALHDATITQLRTAVVILLVLVTILGVALHRRSQKPR